MDLLYKREIAINDFISVRVPLLGEVLDDPDNYSMIVSVVTSMPIDMMVMLDDMGIDFAEITEYDLFLILFNILKEADTSVVFGDLDFAGFEPHVNPQNEMVVLRNEETGAVIDRAIHAQMAETLRTLNNIKKDRRKPANKEAKEFMLERARKKLKRKKKQERNELEDLIIALVNTEQFKYNFETVRNLTIYQFYESVRQIIKKVDYSNRMIGVYAGTIEIKSMSQDDWNWLIH